MVSPPPKIPLQLTIDLELRNRLKNFSEQTGIPMVRVVTDLLTKYLPKLEEKYDVTFD